MNTIIKVIRKTLRLNLKPIGEKEVILNCNFIGKVTRTMVDDGDYEFTITEISENLETQKEITFQHNIHLSRYVNGEHIEISFKKTLQKFIDLDLEMEPIVSRTQKGGLIWSRDNHKKSSQLCDAIVISTRGL